jgi:hypothetical protein
MGWVRKTCPLEEYWKRQKTPFSDVFSSFLETDLKDRCPSCEFWQDGKCKYKKITAQKEQGMMRGYPVLVKRTVMNKPRELRAQFEQAALKYSGLTKEEQKQYWEISSTYDNIWEAANPDEKTEILWRMDEWKRYIDDGYSLKEASELADEMDYSFKLKMENLFRHLPEAYMFKGISKEKANSIINNLMILGGTLWIEALETVIDYHKHHYYTLDNPLISDAEYDWLKEQLHGARIQAEKRTGRREN